MNTIDFCELKIGAKELSPISDEVIISCLSGYEGKDAILRILLFSTYEYDNTHNLKDVINYYSIMINQIEKILQIEYTEIEKTALVLTKIDNILTRINGDQLSSLEELIPMFESVLHMSFDTQGMKYISHLIKYRLLYLYSIFSNELYYEPMKNLLIEVKSEYNDFIKLQEFIYNTYATNYGA